MSEGVTQLLINWGNGDEKAIDELLPVVYSELRRIARYQMSRERSSHTLQPTALVHETYLKLIDQRRVDWRNRSQFFGLASQIMRRILVNHARDKVAAKRGGEQRQVSLSVAVDSFEKKEVDLIFLHESLEELAKLDERKSRIVELKFFGGLTTSEIAEVLEISNSTIEREWSFAKAWLFDSISNK